MKLEYPIPLLAGFMPYKYKCLVMQLGYWDYLQSCCAIRSYRMYVALFLLCMMMYILSVTSLPDVAVRLHIPGA
jgi:hypothetical protein